MLTSLLLLWCYCLHNCYALELSKNFVNSLGPKKYAELFKSNKDYDIVMIYTTTENCLECDYLERQLKLLPEEFSNNNVYFVKIDINMKIPPNSDPIFMKTNGIPAVIYYPKGKPPAKGTVYEYNGDKYRKHLRLGRLSHWIRKKYDTFNKREYKQEI